MGRGQEAVYHTPGKNFATGIEDVVKAIQSVYEARGMQMSTKDLRKYQHFLWEELHRSTRAAG